MPKIHVLEKQIAELIAAGEVVERPSSVVKELLENAVDAGATSVTVEIQNGGLTFLRVTDNGCGIAREDVPTAFLRHATSKVASQGDLDAIGTLGFRGEALASIAAVARVELLTRTKEELAGTRYRIEGGEEGLCEDAGCPQGTTIVVRNLFYNTPARMKFMKKDFSEANAVAGVVDKLALSHPEVAFRLIRDGKEVLCAPGDGKLRSAVFAVYGKQFTEGLIPVEYELGGVRIHGFVSRPADARPTRGMQNFFINGRFVKSRTAAAAVEEAFKGSLMAGRHPSCVLHCVIGCGAVDVNVHPAKIEVRFVNERPIFDAFYHAVKSALHAGDGPARMAFEKKETVRASEAPREPNRQMAWRELGEPEGAPAAKADTPFGGEENPKTFELPEISVPAVAPYRPAAKERPIGETPEEKAAPGGAAQFLDALLDAPPVPNVRLSDSAAPYYHAPQKPEFIPSPSEEKPQKRIAPPPMEGAGGSGPFLFVGEAFHTYLILQTGDELILIDKHAAHERLLYEKLKAGRQGDFAQFLLEPVPVTLEKGEYSALLENLALLQKAGFELEDFGTGTVLVRTAPVTFEREDIEMAVIEIAGYLQNHKKEVSTQHLDWVYHNIACRAAVKAGDQNDREELIALARQLHENPEIRYCPHGRPVYLAISKKELEKQFGR